MNNTTGPIITNNRLGGFFLTLKTNLNLTDGEAGFCYAEAAESIADAYSLDREVVRRFLDAPIGRHIADTVPTKFDVTESVQAAFAKWGKSLQRTIRTIQKDLAGPPPSMLSLLKRLTPERHAEVRAAYYKAAEGLASLRTALEQADAEIGGNTELLAEHYLAANAGQVMSRSKLGAHL